MSGQEKIQKLKQLGDIAEKLRAEGKRIVQCHGVFDLLHPGHVYHFTAAKQKGDVLVVSITSDHHVNKGPGRPVFSEQLRAESIASLAAVDFVTINDAPTAVPAINVIRPAVFVKGNEFSSGKDFHGGIKAEMAAVAAAGGTVAFTDEPTFSSTKIINSFFAPYPEAAQTFLNEFRRRYTFEELADYFEKIKKYKVLVIGEAIIDEYHYVKAMNKPPKEAIIATRYENEESFAGGVLACANHVAGYCEKVDLITCLGKQNSKEDFIKSHLKSNINSSFFYHPSAPTIVKRRFMDRAFLTKMFEIYYFDDRVIPPILEAQIIQHLKRVLPRYDLVIAVDYGHGFFSPNVIDFISNNAKFLALNAQTNSANLGFNFITKYPRADYVCIDHYEARLTARQRDVSSLADWEKIIKDISRKLKAKNVVITLGHEGCLSYDGKKLCKIPVLSTSVLDRVGAGDAFLAITAPLVRAGLSPEALGFVGNAVGAVAVTIVGNKQSVEPAILFKSINTMLTI